MDKMIREAMYWSKEGDAIRCELCPHRCLIKVGKRGLCRSRLNSAGKLFAVNYQKSISISVDPIEKKPLYHYHPGSQILSAGPNSCNLSCFFCQNHPISQEDQPTMNFSFEIIKSIFAEYKNLPHRIALTYTEPFTWYEFIHDLAAEIPDLKIVLITNGFIMDEPLSEILPKIDAMNIDIKSINDEFYKKHCGGRVQPVLNTIKKANEQGVHVEVTNLLIPGLNDSEPEITKLAKTMAEINPEMPLHISAYHPDFKCDIPRTTSQEVMDAVKLAKQHLRWVYSGNIGWGSFTDTICEKCNQTIIQRRPNNVKMLMADEAEQPACKICNESVWGRF